jgi:hypothetical protein
MMSVKIGLMLIASSASLLAPIAIQAEIYPQYVEIVKQSATCQCTPAATSDELNADESFLLNDDKIGDKAVARFGCDCAAHRRTIFTEISTAKMLIKQTN